MAKTKADNWFWISVAGGLASAVLFTVFVIGPPAWWKATVLVGALACIALLWLNPKNRLPRLASVSLFSACATASVPGMRVISEGGMFVELSGPSVLIPAALAMAALGFGALHLAQIGVLRIPNSISIGNRTSTNIEVQGISGDIHVGHANNISN